MSEENTIDVEIFGRTYTLLSEHDPTYARDIADYVDRRMTEVAEHQNLADTGKIAIMTALEIADEIMSCRDRRTADVQAAEEGRVRLTQSMNEAETGR